MKELLFRSVKIIAAAVLAILVAQALGLDFAVSAGIVAILSVQPTKKETLRTALARFLAFAVALAISLALFNLLGFTLPVFFIYLAIFILLCQIIEVLQQYTRINARYSQNASQTENSKDNKSKEYTIT